LYLCCAGRVPTLPGKVDIRIDRKRFEKPGIHLLKNILYQKDIGIRELGEKIPETV